MIWELALFMILLPASYWGVVYVWRRPFGSPTFGWMLVGTAAACGVGLLGRDQGAGAWATAIGAIGVGVGTFALILAPLLRTAARWAVSNDRLALAAFLVDVRDVLQPGMGGKDDKRMVAALRDVKEGRVDHAVAALEALRDRAPAGAVPAIDERITLLYLSAQRFEDAVRWAERTLLDPGSKLSPAVCVELIGARLRLGELDESADLAVRFLASARNQPELVFLVYRLQLIFLAHLGRVPEVDRLLDPSQAATVSRAARRYWAGVARHAAGDVEGARTAFFDAKSLAGRDRRSRALVDIGLRDLERPPPTPTPRARELADALAASPVAMPPRAPGRRGGATALIIAANLAVAAVCGLALGGWGDLGSIVRVGANVRTMVDQGEVWRLASSVFVHVGYLHLLLNMLALWSLGRLVEGMFGRTRMIAIYGIAGLGGALASHTFAKAGISAGASGAIFGLLGALLIELALHRKRYRREWRRQLFGALAFVTVAQLGLGFAVTMIDQWAHVGGLVAGAAVGAALSPGWRWADHPAAIWGARVAAALVAAAFVYGAIGAATTDYGDTLRAQPRVSFALDHLLVDVPDSWHEENGELVDDELYVVLALGLDSDEGRDLPLRLSELETIELKRAVDRGFSSTTRAAHVLALPDGWRGSEWIVTTTDSLNSVLRYRLLTFVGATGGVPIGGALYVPDVMAQDAAPELAKILDSIRPPSPGGPGAIERER